VSRRRSSEFAISLFAFQDIITSVSGVLIMIVLLLAIELTQQTFSSAASTGFERTAQQIRHEQQRLVRESAELESSLLASEESIRLATRLPAELLAEKIRSEQAAIETAQAQLQQLRGAADSISRAEREIQSVEETSKENVEELLRLESRIQEVRKTLEQLTNGEWIAYSAPQGIDPRQGWLCDVSETQLKLHSMSSSDRSYVIDTFGDNESAKSSLAFRKLAEWSNRQAPSPQYLLFLIRPSGAWLGRSLTENKQSLSVQFGIELIGEEQQIVAPKGDPIQ